MMNTEYGSLTIGYDHSDGDLTVVTIAEQNNGSHEVINTLHGEQAAEVLSLLLGQKVINQPGDKLIKNDCEDCAANYIGEENCAGCEISKNNKL